MPEFEYKFYTEIVKFRKNVITLTSPFGEE